MFHLNHQQELLTYLAMFVKTDPMLFDEMLQIRVGLIMEVLAAEYGRVTGLNGLFEFGFEGLEFVFFACGYVVYILLGKDEAGQNWIIVKSDKNLRKRYFCLNKLDGGFSAFTEITS